MAKILVVDDEPDMIWAITNVLLAENHSVVSVSSGEEALAKVKEIPVDLALLDFRLPGMDGIQILEKMKSLRPELPVIMVTGYGGIEEAVQSIKLGAAHYIAKPFDNDHLIETVNKSLELNQLKKEGVFGQRLAEKIAPSVSSEPASAGAPAKAAPGGGAGRWIAGLAALALLTGAGFWALRKMRPSQREWTVTYSKISGLTWGNGNLWMSDWFSQSIQQYELRQDELVLIKSYPLSGMHLTGIAWMDGYLFTCDSWKKTITKHFVDDKLTVAASVPSPGPNPSGLFFDGKYLWSCDGTTRKITQHAPDAALTALAQYDTPALFPVGLTHDSVHFWTASAVGMKLYQNLMPERFRLEKVYLLPEARQAGKQISAFTMEGGKIWFAFEGVNKIYRRDPKDLVETSP